MQSKILILISLFFLSIVYFQYRSVPKQSNSSKKNSRQRIQWADKNSPFKNSKKKPNKNVKQNTKNYFSFPDLDKLKSIEHVNTFLQRYSIEKINVHPKWEFYYKMLEKDAQIATALLKDIDIYRKHELLLANLQKNPYVSQIKTLKPAQSYTVEIKDTYSLKINKLRGLWLHNKINRESSWLSIIYQNTFFEISCVFDDESKDQNSSHQNFYYFLNDLREKNEINKSKENAEINILITNLQKTANLISSIVRLYYTTENFIIKQQIGFYYRNLVYEWNSARATCAKTYYNLSQKKLDEASLHTAAEIYPHIENYKNIAFTYAKHNKDSSAIFWIQKIKSQNSSEGEYCLAKFYVKKNKAKALKHLEKCFKEGFARFEEVVAPDGGFESLHADKEYKKILHQYIHNY